MKWAPFLKIVYAARGMGDNRKIIGIPPWMMRMGLKGVVKEYAEKGIDSGINPMGLPDIMDLISSCPLIMLTKSSVLLRMTSRLLSPILSRSALLPMKARLSSLR